MITGGIVTLNVSDVGRAVRFYIETLGMKLVEERGADFAIIDAGEGFRIGLRSTGAGAGAKSGSPAIELETKVPIDEAISIYENRGVTFTVERKSGAATIASFRDLDGNLFALVQKQKTK